MKYVGCQSMVDEIKYLLVKRPQVSHQNQANMDEQWRKLFYPGPQHYETVLREYEEFLHLLARFEMEISYLPADATTGLDSIYTHDPLVIANSGVILCNMGKAAAGEPKAAAHYLEQVGVPILGEITGDGRLEGGDVCWLDERIVAVGEGYRTNAEGIRQLRTLLGDAVDEVIPVPLPHWTGPDDCLHLLSFISPVDHDLAVVYSRMMPAPFRQLLLARGCAWWKCRMKSMRRWPVMCWPWRRANVSCWPATPSRNSGWKQPAPPSGPTKGAISVLKGVVARLV
ncbi:MAG: arginine deiminase family protein [Caldilineaceae bacterium]